MVFSKPITDRTLVDHMVREITFAILRNDYKIQQQLPTIRDLAEQFGVTVATAQRALSRLEAMGLVFSRQGSGIKVCDLTESISFGLLPIWVQALCKDEIAASKLLAEVLEVRRALAISFLLTVRKSLLASDYQLLESLLNKFTALIETKPLPYLQMAETDIAITRAFVRQKPNTALTLIYNVFEQLILSIPALQHALYAHPEENIAGYQNVMTALASDTDDATLYTSVQQAFQHIDALTIERFRNILRQEKHQS